MKGDIINVKTDTLEFKAEDSQASHDLKKRLYTTLGIAPDIDVFAIFWPSLVRIVPRNGVDTFIFHSAGCDVGLHRLIQDIPGYVSRWDVCADLEGNLVTTFRPDLVVSRGRYCAYGLPVETHDWHSGTGWHVRLYRGDLLRGGNSVTRLEIEKRTKKIGTETPSFWRPVVTGNGAKRNRNINKFWGNIINKIEHCYNNDIDLCPGRGIPKSLEDNARLDRYIRQCGGVLFAISNLTALTMVDSAKLVLDSTKSKEK